MGRTVGTFRQLIEEAAMRWAKFRRALRREDQEFFDRVFLRARCYTQAATYQCHDNPMEAILLAVAVDQEKRLHALEEKAGVVALPENQDASPSTIRCWAARQLFVAADPSTSLRTSAATHKTVNSLPPGRSLEARIDLKFEISDLKQSDAHRRMDLRSLPEPAGDDAVADGSEPEASPAD